ncbi:MAG: secretin N-terminal domain-containing protein [Planctomycetota bacterium]
MQSPFKNQRCAKVGKAVDLSNQIFGRDRSRHGCQPQNGLRSSLRVFSRIVASTGLLLLAASSANAQRANAPQVRRVQVAPAMADSIAMRLSLLYHDQVGVTITTDDARSGSLLVMAPPQMHDRIAKDIRNLQQRLTSSTGSTGGDQMFHLSQVTWREFEDALRAIGDGSQAITVSRDGELAAFQITLPQSSTANNVRVDRRNNTVTVVGGEGNANAWKAIVSTLDQRPKYAGEVTEVVRLENAEPAPIQRAIRLLRALPDSRTGNRPASSRWNAKSNGTPARSASNRQAGIFQTANYASPQDAGAAAATESVPGDQATLDALESMTGEEGGVIGDTQIQFIPESGLIIIKGAKRDVQRVMDVIKEIEEQSELTRPDVQVRQLDHADANAVAALLTQLYEDVLSARQGEVSITSLDTPNALLLIGRTEAIAAVLDLIAKIDQPIKESDRLRVFRLQHASALDAEATIRAFFTNSPGGDEDLRPGTGIRVRISADYRTNSLIVSASPRDLAEVTRLIEELDISKVPASSEIRVFPLSNARAEDLVTILQEALAGESEEVPNDTTAPATTLKIVALGMPGSPTLDSGVLAGIVITADNNANSVVVRGPSDSMPLVAELIRQLDTTPGIDSLVKVFTIENGDATQLTTALQTLFGDEAATTGTNIGAGNQAGLPSLSAAESALVPLRFSTDIRTNSIVASGSADDLEVVESILLRLDSQGFAERITEVIWLKHQIASNIAVAIQDYVSQRQQFQNIIPQFQQGLGPLDLPDRDVIAVAEGQTNSLLISVSPRLYEEVRRLIDRLDRRPPMVLIKTLIAEVRLDDGFEIGGEAGLQDSLLFDRGIAVTPDAVPTLDAAGLPIATAAGNIANGFTPGTPGFNFNNVGLPNNNASGRGTLASQGVTAFGVAQSALTSSGTGGFVFSAASESVNLFLRTLQTANRLQILSRPEVMTTDNVEGLITVGQSFPRPTEIVVNQFGGTQVGIEDVDVGIILRVTPRVGADGLIIMNIDATRSAVNDDDGQIIGFFDNDSPIIVPAIDQTVAQSTITAFDGQTVIFGGLIQKQRLNATQRVPYLADIPLLGTFFKYDRETEFRSELLVIMTPMLIAGDEDLEYVKQVESSRMSWCLPDVVEAHGDVGLSGGYGLWGPAIGPTIYPDVHPTVDVFPAQDMPGGPAAVHGRGVMMPAGVTTESIPGIQLAPGESIISEGAMIDGGSETTSSGFGTEAAPMQPTAPVAPGQQVPGVGEVVPPAGTLPAPTPVQPSSTSVVSPSDRSASNATAGTPVMAASARVKSEQETPAKKWSQFWGDLTGKNR